MINKVISVVENPFRLGDEGLKIVGCDARVLFRREDAPLEEPFIEVAYKFPISGKTSELAERAYGPGLQKRLKELKGQHLVEPLDGMSPEGRPVFVSVFPAKTTELYWDDSRAVPGESLRRYLEEHNA